MKGFLAACFYGAFTFAAILIAKKTNGDHYLTLAVVGSAVAYEPVMDFFKRMNEGLPVFVADVEALLEWAYAEEGRTVAIRFMSNNWRREKCCPCRNQPGTQTDFRIIYLGHLVDD